MFLTKNNIVIGNKLYALSNISDRYSDSLAECTVISISDTGFIVQKDYSLHKHGFNWSDLNRKVFPKNSFTENKMLELNELSEQINLLFNSKQNKLAEVIKKFK